MLYLAYGSNMSSVRLRQRVPSARPVAAARLPGWEMRFHKRSRDGSGKCNIVPSDEPGAVVHGVVFEIEPAEKPGLDDAEVLAFGYRCQDVRARIGTRWISAFTYIAGAPFLDDSLLPYSWYRDFVVTGAREHGLPESYLANLLAIQVRTDPDSHRAAENRSLL